MRTILIALISVLVGYSAADEAPKPIEELFSKMRKAYSSISSAEMQVKIKQAAQKGDQSGRFSVKYAQPNKLRYLGEVGSNHVERYCNGKFIVTIRNSNRISDKVINVTTLSGNLPGNLEWLCLLDWKRQLSTTPPKGQTTGGNTMAFSTFKLSRDEKWNNKSWLLLEETAKGMGLKVRYYIDPKTFLIWRCDVSTLADGKARAHTEVTSLKLGVKFDPSTFEAPKEG